ncbi:MAG: hypothetical protein ACKVQR_17620 [Aquabacterium sp.]
MPRVQTITNNFTGGEMSPRMRGRVDLDRYNASAKTLENVVVLRQGGVTARPSLDYLGDSKTHSTVWRPVPFIYSRDDAYVLEFGDLYMRVWRNGAQVESTPGTPYEIVTPFAASELASLDWAQQADTMIIASGTRVLKRLRRFGHASWVLDDAPIDPAPMAEIGERNSAITMTTDNVAVGAGRTITAGAGFFLNADIGRVIGWGTGLATITAVGGTTTATATVTQAFDNASSTAWTLYGSPLSVLTPTASGPVGTSTNFTLAGAGWRSNVAGNYLEINGGLVRITSRTSDTVVAGTIVTELTGTTAAPADAWVMKQPAWNSVDGYPTTVSFYQQRLWAASTTKYPQSLWGSRSGLYFDYTPGVNDDHAVYKTIDADEVNAVQFLTSFSALVIMTYGGEFDARGGVEKPITQTNCQITKWSRFGAALVRPEECGTEVFYAQRGGLVLRVMSRDEVGGIGTREVSIFSDHLLENGIQCMSWEQTPEQVLWIADESGGFAALTYAREQQVAAFAGSSTDGVIEWFCTVPEGATDVTYAAVRRTINGATKRYIEKLNWSAAPGLDSRKSVTLGSPGTAFTGFGHLAAKTVALLADGVYVGTAVVTAGGGITAPRNTTTLQAGLPYTPTVVLPAPEVGTGMGTGQAQQQSVSQIWVRFLETTGCTINGKTVAFRTFGEDVLDQAPPSFTGFKQVAGLGWSNDEETTLAQPQPYPWTVLVVVRTVTVNAG